MGSDDDSTARPQDTAGDPGAAEPAAGAISGKDLLHAAQAQFEEQVDEKPPRFVNGYGLVLIVLVTSFLLMSVGGDHISGRIVSVVFLATTTWLALRASGVTHRVLKWAVTLLPLFTLGAVIAIALGSEETGRIAGSVLTFLLVVVTPLAIARRLLKNMVVSYNAFYGAVCIYLMLAMFFANAYSLASLTHGDQFFAQIVPPDKATAIDYLYFSFITMTTVGYGDLTAAFSLGRMLAAIEAIMGQLYLITVVALVVQNLGQQRRLKSFKDRLDK